MDVLSLYTYTTLPRVYKLKTKFFQLRKFPGEIPERIDKRFKMGRLKFTLKNFF